MDPNTFPTKGNLILAKNSLALSRQGYELMDKKRNILIREMMELIDQAKDIQTQIDETFRTAYAALAEGKHGDRNRFCRPDLSYRSCRKFHPDQDQECHGN